MKYLRPAAIIGCCVGIAILMIWWLTSASPDAGHKHQRLLDNNTARHAANAVAASEGDALSIPQTPEPKLVVSPTHELDDIIESFEKELIEESQRVMDYVEAEAEWRVYRRDGGTCWGSEEWMKTPEYYSELDTQALAVECYERTIFAHEMTIYDDPKLGWICLKIMHDGFAELFRRPDLWKGILAVYDMQASKLNPSNDLLAIRSASLTLHSLHVLYTLPEFKQQVQGREKEFLQAHVKVLKMYRDYIDRFDPEHVGASVPFFMEPVVVGEVSLMLLKQVNPSAYAHVEPVIRQIKWPQKQDLKDIRNFLEIVITATDDWAVS